MPALERHANGSRGRRSRTAEAVRVNGEWEACVCVSGACGTRACVTERRWNLRYSGTRDATVRGDAVPTARAVKRSREKCVRAKCICVTGEDGMDHSLYTQDCSCGNHHPDFLLIACVCMHTSSDNECPVVYARTARHATTTHARRNCLPGHKGAPGEACTFE